MKPQKRTLAKLAALTDMAKENKVYDEKLDKKLRNGNFFKLTTK